LFWHLRMRPGDRQYKRSRSGGPTRKNRTIPSHAYTPKKKMPVTGHTRSRAEPSAVLRTRTGYNDDSQSRQSPYNPVPDNRVISLIMQDSSSTLSSRSRRSYQQSRRFFGPLLKSAGSVICSVVAALEVIHGQPGLPVWTGNTRSFFLMLYFMTGNRDPGVL
jgi:hypothetical protein